MSDYEIGRLNRNVLIKIVKEQQEIINKAIEKLEEGKEEVEDISWVEMRSESYIEEMNEIENILKGEKNEYNK